MVFFTNMKFNKLYRILVINSIVSVAWFLLISCNKQKDDPSTYFTQQQLDSLTINMITCVYNNAPGATDATKWKSQYRSYYSQYLSSFRLEKYEKAANGWSYYFLIRPVGGSKFRRGVIGKFKIKAGSLMPTSFEETVNTPHLDEELVKERGTFLFKELLKNDNLNKYLAMKHYVEWPDNRLVYDKIKYKWATLEKP